MARLPLTEFADRVSGMMHVMSKEFFKHQAGGFYKLKITIPQLVVLNFLSRQGESNMTDAARFMNVTTAAMTGIVDRLVRDGYAIRSHDPNDRRVVRVKPTAKGAKLIEEVNAHRRKVLVDIFGKISEDEREDYLRILTRICDAVRKEG